MNTKSSAQVSPKIQPNLSHRHGDKIPQTAYQLCSAIDEIIVRSESVITLIQLHATNEAEEVGSQPNPQAVYFALESVCHDLRDIRMIVEAFAKGAA